jgi:[ribosomal protein S5]-alanine N-acetyltransferase
LEIQPVIESDRRQFVDLFMDSDFMVYSATGALDGQAANTRFDHMVAFSRKVAFGKQAIIETSTGTLVGYVGADEFEFGGESRLEFGYRVVRALRGLGYATEAASALLEVARDVWQGELLALIDPNNGASRNVLVKTGFEFVEPIMVNGDSVELYRRLI